MTKKSRYIIIVFMATFALAFFWIQAQPEQADYTPKILADMCNESDEDTSKGVDEEPAPLRWTNERDRAWTEDILHFRDTIIRLHPMMQNIETFMYIEPSLRGVSLRRSFFDEKAKGQLVDYADNLIERIQHLSDFEIEVGLSRLTTLLSDSHTQVLFSELHNTERIPFNFWVLCDGWYVWRAYQDFEEAIFSRLDAIGGISISEIIEMLRPIFPHENDIVLEFLLWHVLHRDFAVYLGIIYEDDMAVSLTLTNIEGYVFTIDAPFMNWVEVIEAGTVVASTIDEESFLMYSREGEIWWVEYFPKESLMYVRFRSFQDDFASRAFWNEQVITKLYEISGVDTFVIDFRGNMGGIGLRGFNDFMEWTADEANRELLGTVFVAVDRMSYSRGVLSAAQIRNTIDSVTIIGQPTMGLPNTFGFMDVHSLPNSSVTFAVSTRFALFCRDHESDTFMPDIHIPRIIEDYINSHDAVLAFIRAYGRGE